MKKAENLEIYQKAMHIFKLVESFVSTLPEDDPYVEMTKGIMMEDAIIIPAKIVGAEGGDLYSIRMQNAAIIRNHAMSLYVQMGSFNFFEKSKDVDYITIIRDEINEFKKLFIEWVASFDTQNHIWDDWGLFNPSGAIEPDENDDEPFDLEDFDDEDDF